MKIVINGRYGGFSLSDKAIRLYAKKKGWKLYPEASRIGAGILPDTYWLVPKSKRPKEIENWHEASLEDRQAYNEAYRKAEFASRDLERNCATLIEVVQELGKEASGRCASLEIIEIPDDVEWQIEEYDGNEWVAEKHRKWS